jgi:hypothetical protein
MHPAITAAEREFNHFLHGIADRPPALHDLSCVRDHYNFYVVFRARFSNGTEIAWRVAEAQLDSHPSIFNDHRLSGDREPTLDRYFERELRSLYSRCFENHLMGAQYRVMREAADYAAMTIGDVELAREWLRNARALEDHARIHHQQQLLPPMNYSGVLFREVDDLEGVRVEYASSRLVEATRAQNLYNTWRSEALQNFSRENLFMTYMGLDMGLDLGDEASREKGLKLLKEWLSSEQLKQYEKQQNFDVIGSDTGKRYRIRHGHQMNIDEIDVRDRKVCGWCFLPEGALVAGDVMLGQKIALENFEKKALALANRF